MALFSIHFIKDDGVVVPHAARRYAAGSRLRSVVLDACRYYPDRRFVVRDENGSEWFRHEPEAASADTAPGVFR